MLRPAIADLKTIQTYDESASAYADSWLGQGEPLEIHAIVREFFLKGGLSADVGCGSGRDVHWLNQQGYPCTGFDASEGLLREARKRFGAYQFLKAELPALSEVSDAVYDNILCETVLMHLPELSLELALENLLRIAKPAGVLSLSWRLGIDTADQREKDGRLYSAVDKEKVKMFFISKGATLLASRQIKSSSSQKIIEQMVVRK